MILQIATRSGLPPSIIADTWSPDELQDAEVLAGLEGWGQEKRRTAAILAEMHNISRMEAYAQAGDPKAPPPKMLTESHFLPRRVKQPAKAREQKVADTNRKMFGILNSLCGY